MRALHFRRRGSFDLHRTRNGEQRTPTKRDVTLHQLTHTRHTRSRTNISSSASITNTASRVTFTCPRSSRVHSPRRNTRVAKVVTKTSSGLKSSTKGRRSSLCHVNTSILDCQTGQATGRGVVQSNEIVPNKTARMSTPRETRGRKHVSRVNPIYVPSPFSSEDETYFGPTVVVDLSQTEVKMVSQSEELSPSPRVASRGVEQGTQLSPCPFTVLSGSGVYSSPNCKPVQPVRNTNTRPPMFVPERATTFRILPPEPNVAEDKENISSSLLTSIRRKIKSLCEPDSHKQTVTDGSRDSRWEKGWDSLPSVAIGNKPVPELPVSSFSRISLADSGYRSTSSQGSLASIYASFRRRRRSGASTNNRASSGDDTQSELAPSRPTSKEISSMLGQACSDQIHADSHSNSDTVSIQSRPLPPLPRQNPEPLPPRYPLTRTKQSTREVPRVPPVVPPCQQRSRAVTVPTRPSRPAPPELPSRSAPAGRTTHTAPPVRPSRAPMTHNNTHQKEDNHIRISKTIDLSNVLRNKWVSGMAVSKKGELIIADLKDVYIMDNDGNLKRTLGGGKGSARLVEPIDVTVLTNGNIAVSDHADRSIKVFTSKGQFVRVIRGPGLVNIAGVASTERREILVAATDSRCISIHSEEGSTIGQIPNGDAIKRSPFDHPYSLAVNPLSGALIVGDDYRQRVTAVSCDGKVLWRFCPTGDRIFFPSSISVDATGYVFIADLYNEKVYMLDSGGKYLKTVLARGQGLRGGPGSVAVDNQGHLFVADEEKTIKMFRYETRGSALEHRSCEGPNYSCL